MEDEQTVAAWAAASGETSLIVDDEATIRHFVDEVLDEQGYTVIGAADGAAGIKVLQSGAKIELLITPHFALLWREQGGPPVVTPTRRGFGTRMIERSLRSYFRGQTALSYPSEGVEFRIDAPLAGAGTVAV